MPDVVAALHAALPPDAFAPVDDAAALDALGPSRGFDAPAAPAPLAVVAPATTEQVVAVIRVAGEYATPIVPYGAGTGLMGGARSLQSGIVLDLKRMARVREVDPDAGWAWIEAGAVLADVNRQLAPSRLMLGHDPWTVGLATVGGAISTNGLGFLGGKYGSMGQQVRAREVVLADGTVLRTAPALPHSTGPDLTRLFVAAEGTLGVITAAALRLFPLPEAEVRLGYRFDAFERGFEALLQMQRIGLTPAVLDYGERPTGGPWQAQQPTLYLGFLGVREEADAQVRRAARICSEATPIPADEVEEFWDDRHVPAEGFAQRRRGSWPGGGRCFDYLHVALPASAVLDYRRGATAIAAEHRVDVVETGLWVHAGLFSMVLVTAGDDAAHRMEAAVDTALRLAIDAGGSIEYCHGVGVRLAHLMREQHGAGLDVLRALKHALDPKGILNPGKLGLEP